MIAMNFHWSRAECYGMRSSERKMWAQAIDNSLRQLAEENK